MIAFRWLAGSLIFFTVLVFEHAEWGRTLDPFSGRRDAATSQAPSLFGNFLADMRVNHVLTGPRYDVMVIGNSRTSRVGAADIGLPKTGYFNFSEGHFYLRSHARIVEALAEANRLPATIAIAVDNFAIRNDAQPRWPWGWRRIVAFGGDIADLMAMPREAAGDLSILVWREIGAYADRLRRFASAELHLRLLAMRFDWAWPATAMAGETMLIGPDGSYADNTATFITEVGIDPFDPYGGVGRRVIPSLFIADMNRIAQAAKSSGSRVILFELPLEPHYQAGIDLVPRAEDVALRAAFLEHCARLGLECSVGVRADSRSERDGWYDNTHPSGALLGRIIADLLNSVPAGPQSRDIDKSEAP